MSDLSTRATRGARSRSLLALGGFGLIALAVVGLRVGHAFDAFLGGGPRDREPIMYMGRGSQTTSPFHLTGGTYRTLWTAWERAPEYPPCTHSAELMAEDPTNGTTSSGHVVDLARFAHVPATGATVEGYVVNVKPGDYYLHVYSECSWQISITPN